MDIGEVRRIVRVVPETFPNATPMPERAPTAPVEPEPVPAGV